MIKYTDAKLSIEDFSARKSDILLNESVVNTLFEKKGVALYDFKGEMKGIFDYIVSEIQRSCQNIPLKSSSISEFGKIYNIKSNVLTFGVPKSILKGVNFIKNLNIAVTARIFENQYPEINDYLKRTAISYVPTIKNSITLFKKKLRNGVVLISFSVINGAVDEEAIWKNLYHELGHLYQEYMIRFHTNNKNSLFSKNSGLNLNFYRGSSDEGVKMVYWILYILFNNEELSQFATSIYAELSSNPNKNIEETEAYTTYTNLLKDIEWLNSVDSSSFWLEVGENFEYYKKKHKTIEPFWFKNYFINTAVKKVKKYYKKMKSAAELYYNNLEND